MNRLTYIGCISLCGTLFALIPSVCGQESGGGSKLPQKAAVLEASGPWQVKVTTEQHGITTTSQLDVCPPETLAVTDENHGVLKPWSLGGYFWDNPAIAGLTDGPNTWTGSVLGFEHFLSLSLDFCMIFSLDGIRCGVEIKG